MRISCCRLKSVSLPLLSRHAALPSAGSLWQGPRTAVGPGHWGELGLHQGAGGGERAGRMEGKSKRDGHILPMLTLQPSRNASGSSWSSSQPLAPILSCPVPFLVYTPSPSIYFRSHWPLLIFLTPFTFPGKSRVSARFCDPFPQALYTHLPPQNVVWILPILLGSLSTASLLESPLPIRSLS